MRYLFLLLITLYLSPMCFADSADNIITNRKNGGDIKVTPTTSGGSETLLLTADPDDNKSTAEGNIQADTVSGKSSSSVSVNGVDFEDKGSYGEITSKRAISRDTWDGYGEAFYRLIYPSDGVRKAYMFNNFTTHKSRSAAVADNPILIALGSCEANGSTNRTLHLNITIHETRHYPNNADITDAESDYVDHMVHIRCVDGAWDPILIQPKMWDYSTFGSYTMLTLDDAGLRIERANRLSSSWSMVASHVIVQVSGSPDIDFPAVGYFSAN